MLESVKRMADRLSPVGVAHAHCDIPCGIYNPEDAIQAAQTCIRMTELDPRNRGRLIARRAQQPHPIRRRKRRARKESER